MEILIEESIEEVRLMLDELASGSDTVLYEGKVLEISKKLDILICNYYKQYESQYILYEIR
jgi:hypothetical protein